jgi:II/X family phage/plasmid replication protein
VIDWCKASLPFDWVKPIHGGHFIVLSPAGEIEKQITKSYHCRGSHDEHVTLRTVERGRVEFDGNPSKFLQLHNLFGSNDLCGLLAAACAKALEMAGVYVSPATVERWRSGDFQVSRVDLTESYDVGTSPADVRAWINAAADLGRIRWRGRGQLVAGTLYYGKVAAGKRASLWSLKAYAKGDEIAAAGKSHKLVQGLPNRDDLTAWAQNKLRVELLLRAGELRQRDKGMLLQGFGWSEEKARSLFQEYVTKIEMGSQMVIDSSALDGMKTGPRLAYAAWEAGQDLQTVLPRASFYRYRRQLLELTQGRIDIANRRAAGNVVPLVRVLEAKPASLPAFVLDGSPLMFARAA